MNALSLNPLKALLACGLAAAALGTAHAQQPVPLGPAGQGTFLIHGNFCGPGNRGPGYPPVDALDLACAHHDACSPAWGSNLLPPCACNRRLGIEAGFVARDPRTPPDTRQTAHFIADLAGSLACR